MLAELEGFQWTIQSSRLHLHAEFLANSLARNAKYLAFEFLFGGGEMIFLTKNNN